MKKKYCLLFLFFAFAFNSYSNSLEIRVDAAQTKVLLGMPIEITLSYLARHEVNLYGKSRGVCDPQVSVYLETLDGRTADFAFPAPCSLDDRVVGLDSKWKFRLQGSQSFYASVFALPGKYRLYWRFRAVGPYYDLLPNGDKKFLTDFWTGQIESNKLNVDVEMAEGENLHALLALGPKGGQTGSPEPYARFLSWQNREKIMEQFPQTTYAAYARWLKGYSLYKVFEKFSIDNCIEFSEKIKQPNNFSGARSQLQEIRQYWEPLYNNFPSFSDRAKVLSHLSKVYFLSGEPKRAVPLLKELTRDFPTAASAENTAEYVNWLKSQKLWID